MHPALFQEYFRSLSSAEGERYAKRHARLLHQYALDYHSLGKPGKLEIQATKQLDDDGDDNGGGGGGGDGMTMIMMMA